MGVEYSDLIKLKAQYVEMVKAQNEINMAAAHKVGQLAMRIVKRYTPVDTGDLRKAWEYDILKKGDSYIIIISNNMDYASYVESGHRIVANGVTIGWQEGRFMLKMTEEALDKHAPIIWEKEIEKGLRAYL